MMNLRKNKLTARKILGILMTAIILLTTSGFSVFHHYCKSSHSSEYSLFIPEFSCEHHHHAQGNIPPCCADDHASDRQNCGTSDCCTTNVITVKLNITLITQDIEPWQTQLSSFAVEHSMIVEGGTEIEQSGMPAFNNNHPPPLSGREFHIFTQQLNIPDSAV